MLAKNLFFHYIYAVIGFSTCLLCVEHTSAQELDTTRDSSQPNELFSGEINEPMFFGGTRPHSLPFHTHITFGYSTPATLPAQTAVMGWMLQADLTDLITPRRVSSIHIRSENNEIHEGSIHYTEPQVWNSDFDISIGTIVRNEKTLYTTYKGDFHVRYPLSSVVNLTGLIGYEHVSPGSLATVYKSNNIRLMGTFEYDGQFVSLRDGVSFQARLSPSLTAKKLNGKNSYDFNIYNPKGTAATSIFELSASSELLMRTFSDDLIFQSTVVFGWLYSGTRKIQQTDVFALGGRYSLRGYYESEFSPTLFTFTSLDYQWSLSRIFTLTAFCDVGYMRTENTIAFENESFTPLDVGLSLDVISSFGTFTSMLAAPTTENADVKFYLTYSHEL